ncbi:hypothetical protein PMAYCL1PPCAC_08774, partial [Pristionchus mayeri]
LLLLRLRLRVVLRRLLRHEVLVIRVRLGCFCCGLQRLHIGRSASRREHRLVQAHVVIILLPRWRRPRFVRFNSFPEFLLLFVHFLLFFLLIHLIDSLAVDTLQLSLLGRRGSLGLLLLRRFFLRLGFT